MLEDEDPARIFDRAVAAVDNAENVMAAIEAVRAAYRLDNAAYQLGQPSGAGAEGPYLRSTWPTAWLTRYLLKGYTLADPVVTEGLARTEPFDWRDLPITEQTRAMVADAAAHGLAGFGFSVPIADSQGRRAVFSVCANMDEAAWDSFARQHRTGWVEIAHVIHRKAVAEIAEAGSELPKLTAREIEALSLTADGKSAKEIGRQLDISARTVEAYLASARHKLGAENTVKAIAKAVKLRVIDL